MIKKTLLYTFKTIKLSVWLSVFTALLIALIVAFFLLFPASIKTPLQTQLSQLSGMDVKLSKLSFDFKHNSIVLKINNIQINSPKQQSVAQIDGIYLHINFFNLFDDNYNMSKIYIDTLDLYFGDNMFYINDITPILLDNFRFVKLLRVNKTLIKKPNNTVLLTLSPLTFSRMGKDFALKIPKQNIGAMEVDVDAVLSTNQFANNDILTMPLKVQNKDFLLSSVLRLYQKNTDSILAIDGTIAQMKATNLGQYFFPEWVGKNVSKWLNDAFVAGSIEAAEIKFKQNLSVATPFELNLRASSKDMVFSFHPDWQNLQHLDADIVMDNKNIAIEVNSAKLNNLDLEDIQVRIANFTSDTVNVEIVGEINDDSATLTQFLSAAPLGAELNETLQQFSISGMANAKINVIIPINKSPQPKINIDAQIKNNRLSALNGIAVIENYDANVTYNQGIFSAKGVGNIRNKTFEIDINHNPNVKQDFVIEIGQRVNNFKAHIAKTPEYTWHATIDSDNVQAQLLADFNQSIPQFNIKKLHLKTGIEVLDFHPNDFPSMSLQVENIRVDDYQFPNFKADLHAQQNILNINNLEFDDIGVNQNNLSFNGHWLDGITTLVATAKGDKLSDFLQQLKIQEQAKGGAFDFDLRLFCACNPWDMNLKNISGRASIDVKKGVFSDQDPNIGRVLSLLNIESIAKRLKLEVDDLTHKGFVYDDISALAYLQNSSLKFEHFEVNASSSRVLLSGSSDIVNKQYDMLATVRPAISNSVPIATYLAGGGLAGLGVWLADKILFDSKIMSSVVDSVAEFNYKITGSWDNPIIE